MPLSPHRTSSTRQWVSGVQAAPLPGTLSGAMTREGGGFGLSPQPIGNLTLSGTSVRTPIDTRGIKGAAKMLLIGCTYRDDPAMYLPGAVQDTRAMQHYLTRAGFTPEERRVLIEDNPDALPTRVNILSALRWLVRGAVPGDALFLHFAGHGAHSDYMSHQEEGEALAPLDYKTAGLIYEEEIYDIIAGGLSGGAKVTCIFDCVKVGKVIELPYSLTADSGGFRMTENQDLLEHHIPSQITSITYASDTGAVNGLTTAFISTCNAHPVCTYKQLITDMSALMVQRFGPGAPVPRLSSSRGFELGDVFSLSAMPEAVVFPVGMSSPPNGYQQPRAVQAVQSRPHIQSPHRNIPSPHRNIPSPHRNIQSPHRALTPPTSGRTPVAIQGVPDPSNISDEVAGASKSLFINITYADMPYQIDYDDPREPHSKAFLQYISDIGFQSRNQYLSEDAKVQHLYPTRANIIQAMKWLVKDAVPGDVLLLYYSGYGPFIPQYDVATVTDGIAPVDFETKGFITGDEIHSIVLRNLPLKTKVIFVCDCMHGGDIVRTPFRISCSPTGGSTGLLYEHDAHGIADQTNADVVIFSTKTSESPHSGALTKSLISSLESVPQQPVGPLLKTLFQSIQSHAPDVTSPVLHSTFRLDERALFYFGIHPQNLRGRKAPKPEPAVLSPSRPLAASVKSATGEGQKFTLPGIYKVEGVGDSAAVFIDNSNPTRVTVYDTAEGERKGDVSSNGLQITLDVRNPPQDPEEEPQELPAVVTAEFSPETGVLTYSTGVAWVKEQHAAGVGETGGNQQIASPPSHVNPLLDADHLPRRREVVLGASKALLVGINYNHLLDSRETVQTASSFLRRQGFEGEIRTLVDMDVSPTDISYPSRSNIMTSLRWLVRDAIPGDALFFMFIGECLDQELSPADALVSGTIASDELLSTFSLLPSGTKLTIVLDSNICRDVSLGFPYQFVASPDGGFATKENVMTRRVLSNVIVVSMPVGPDDGVSGVLSTSFMTVMNTIPRATNEEMISSIRQLSRQRLSSNAIAIGISSTQRIQPVDQFCLSVESKPLTVDLLQLDDRTNAKNRAVIISVSYNSRLPYVEVAARDIEALLLRNGFSQNAIKLLSDKTILPTKQNILSAIRWLTTNTEPGDNLILYFTGFGGKPTEQATPPAIQGIAPADWPTHGAVTGSELYAALVEPLPAGVSLLGIFDCVFTATPTGLPYTLTAERDGGMTYQTYPSQETAAHCVFLTTAPSSSAVGSNESNPLLPLQGVLTTSFIQAMQGSPSYGQLLNAVRAIMAGQIVNSGHVARLLSSRRFSETDAFMILNRSGGAIRHQSPVRITHPLSSPVLESPVSVKYQSPVSGYGGSPRRPPQMLDPNRRAELQGGMVEFNKTLNDALHIAKHRNVNGAAANAGRRSPSPVGFQQQPDPPPGTIRKLLLSSVNDPLGMRLNRSGNSMIVESVTPNSAAFRSGIVPGDVIHGIGGYPVHSSNDVQAARSLTVRGEMLEIPIALSAASYSY